MTCCLEFYQGNTTRLLVEDLDFVDGSPIDDATVTVTIYDLAGDALTPDPGWPLALSALGGGDYEAVFDWDFSTFVGQRVRAEVVAVATTGERLEAEAGRWCASGRSRARDVPWGTPSMFVRPFWEVLRGRRRKRPAPNLPLIYLERAAPGSHTTGAICPGSAHLP